MFHKTFQIMIWIKMSVAFNSN